MKLTSKQKKLYLAKIEKALTSNMLFLKNEFSLPDLAQETGITLHTISYLINVEINHHFTDYINLKRIDYFKTKINDADWKDLKTEELMLFCGFKSRTTGYRAFKKHVGITPSEYLKLYRQHSTGLIETIPQV
mgnify:CR=1 FL=1